MRLFSNFAVLAAAAALVPTTASGAIAAPDPGPALTLGLLNQARQRPIWSLGEDLAWGSGGLASPEAVVQAWMDSPPHRHIMLDRHLRVVGIGIVRGTPSGADGATFTADFGS
jgi:hypothetical protein